MRQFDFFLFENFDAEQQAHHPLNPRLFPGAGTDALLSFIASFPAGECSVSDAREHFGNDKINRLIRGGVLRQAGNALLYDCPIFLQEDAQVLRSGLKSQAGQLMEKTKACFPALLHACEKLQNGFPAQVNLYHILCGMIFDGHFFDVLGQRRALATARLHPSGLDYLNVIYEKSADLAAFSDGLLCSYNRLCNAHCALQSFGDANGNRFDFYRFLRLMEQDALPPSFHAAKALWQALDGGRETLLSETCALVHTGRCHPSALSLLEHFGYAKDGALCAPVYLPAHQPILHEMASIAEEGMADAIMHSLQHLSASLPITAVQHGVSALEIANELYHLLFGSLNEALVKAGLVASPPFIHGQGRFLQCIEIN
ncbi:MAG: hypothetical protein IJB69_00100 [Clostridia bacterium]|nr:hypothetical protein [Clostridia bacterium]